MKLQANDQASVAMAWGSLRICSPSSTPTATAELPMLKKKNRDFK
jgi:hypothetical protein